VAEARRLARRALELDKGDPTVLATAGNVLGLLGGELEEGALLLAQASIQILLPHDIGTVGHYSTLATEMPR